MKLVYINPNESGSRPAIQDCNFSSVPDGMAIWPDELDTAVFYQNNSFVNLTFEDREIVVGQHEVEVPAEEEGGEPTYKMQDIVEIRKYVVACEPNTEALAAWKATLPPEPDPVKAAIEAKKEEISDACSAVIVAGVDVETTTGTEHFNLSIEDQSNINNLFRVVMLGGTEYPYQADPGDCRLYSKEEITAIYIAAQTHITSQTAYHNQLKAYVGALETVEEIEAVQYGMELPEPYLSELNEKLLAAQAQMDAILAAMSANG